MENYQMSNPRKMHFWATISLGWIKSKWLKNLCEAHQWETWENDRSGSTWKETEAQRSEGVLSHSCQGAEQTAAAHAFRAMQVVTLRSPVSYHSTALVWVGRYHSHLDSNTAQVVMASVAEGWAVTSRLLRALLSAGALCSQSLCNCSAHGHPFLPPLSTKAWNVLGSILHDLFSFIIWECIPGWN